MCKNKDEFTKLVARRRKLKALERKIEAELDKIDAEIIKYAQAKGSKGGKDNKTLIIIGDNYKVSVIEITQHPFDGAKLKEYFGDDISKYQKTNTYNRIDIR